MVLTNKISRYFAPFLAWMIFISSMSYTIDFHYCQGDLKSFSFFGEAQNCHEMAAKKTACCHKKLDSTASTCGEEEDGCCNNETHHFESDIEQQLIDSDIVNFELHSFENELSVLSNVNFLFSFKELPPFDHYKPPLIHKDIPVLFESFLI